MYKQRSNKKRYGSRKHVGGFSKKKKVSVDDNPVTVAVDEDPVMMEEDVEESAGDASLFSNICEEDNLLSNVAGSSSLSSKKLKKNLFNETFDYGNEGTIFFNTDLLLTMLRETSCCPDCYENIDIEFMEEKKVGLAQFIKMKCNSCNWEREYCSSKKINKQRKGQSPYEINLTSMIAFREIGVGYNGMKNFCGVMNMPPPMNKSAFQKLSKVIHKHYVDVAKMSMKQAALEVRNNVSDEVVVNDTVIDTTASFDGTWQKRGHVSFNGVVTAMSLEGKCIDYEVKSKVCKSCQYWRKHTDSSDYQKWKDSHDCTINHEGSAGKMETEGVMAIYNRSVKNNRLRYTTYLGDGDSKSFKDVRDAKPYGDDVLLQKAECVGHVQKRVGTRLRDLKIRYRGVKLSDGKNIGGAGRLNEKAINTLQNYYGIAIRQNDELYAMKKNIAAALHHLSEAPTLEERHKWCPRTEDSWCKYQVDKIVGSSTYKTKLTFPKAIYNLLAPIFGHDDLGSDDILSRCLHGRTQNVNECINNSIWLKCPKRVYVGLKTLEMGVASAVISFNDGGIGLFPLFDKLNIPRGQYRMSYLVKKDADRTKLMDQKWSDMGKRRRSKLRSIRKKFTVESEGKEGEVYGKGRFHE